MRHRDEVFSHLEADKIAPILEACSLPEKQEYTEDEAARISYCREMIEQQGKTSKQAKAYFRRQDQKKADTQTLNMRDILNTLAEEHEVSVSMTEMGQIMTVTGMADQQSYNQQEYELLISAFMMLKVEGKTYQEIAQELGVNSDEPEEMVLNRINDSARGLADLVDKITDIQAGQMPDLINQVYLYKVAQKLKENQGNVQAFYAALEQRILERIQGKSPLETMFPSIGMNRLPDSSVRPIPLPPDSENGPPNE